MTTTKTQPARVHADTEVNDGSWRIAILGALLVLAFLLGAVRLLSQEGPNTGSITIRPLVGAYVPTGDQRSFLKDAVLLGAQGTWYSNSNLSVTGSFGWAPSKDKI